MLKEQANYLFKDSAYLIHRLKFILKFLFKIYFKQQLYII